MGYWKNKQIEDQENNPEHCSGCSKEWDGEEPCSCNDVCSRCGCKFENGTTEDTEKGICDDCWAQVLVRD